MPTILWHDEEAAGYTDFLPASWFTVEGRIAGRIHKVVGPRRRIHNARCNVTVSKSEALLDYEAHRRFNTSRGMCLGVMRLQFTGPQRSEISQVWWREPEGSFQPASTTVGLEDWASSEVGDFREGRVLQVELDRYERDPLAREACLRHHGLACSVCKLDFGTTYGPVADGFIHIHHLRPLSKTHGDHKVNPRTDLRPVCPNCHAVIHLGNRCRSIEAVKKLLQRKRS